MDEKARKLFEEGISRLAAQGIFIEESEPLSKAKFEDIFSNKSLFDADYFLDSMDNPPLLEISSNNFQKETDFLIEITRKKNPILNQNNWK